MTVIEFSVGAAMAPRLSTALASETGPEPWPREVLEKLGRGLKDRKQSPGEAVRLAVASGHGIGTSALVAWVTCGRCRQLSDTRGIVTANTEGQLRTKTWPELAKWHALSINRDWFTYTATSLASSRSGRDHTWRRGYRRPGTTRASAPSPCWTRPRRSPTACGRPSRAR